MKKQGAATLKDGLQRRFLRNGRRLNVKPTIIKCSALLQKQWKPFCAIIVQIGTSYQPALHCLQCSAAETVKASLISGHAAEGSLHWGLKAGLGLVTPSVRQTNQAISRCCVVDRETLS